MRVSLCVISLAHTLEMVCSCREMGLKKEK